MPIRVTDHVTGMKHVLQWDSQRDPSDQEIEQLIAQQTTPPAGMAPTLPGRPRGGFDLPPSLSDLASRTKVAGSVDAASSLDPTSREQSTFAAGRQALAGGVSDALNTPIATRLGADSYLRKREAEVASQPPLPMGDGYDPVGGLMLARSLTPGHVAAAASLGAEAPLARIAANAPLAAGGVSRMMDPAEDWKGKGLGAVDAILSIMGMRPSMPHFGGGRGGGGGGGGVPPAPPVVDVDRFGNKVMRVATPARDDVARAIPPADQPVIASEIQSALDKPLGNIIKGADKGGLADLDAAIGQEQQMAGARRANRVREDRNLTIAEQKADREIYEQRLREEQGLTADTATLLDRSANKTAQTGLNQIDQNIARTAQEGAATRRAATSAENRATGLEQRADADWYRQQQAAAAAVEAENQAAIRAQMILDAKKAAESSEAAAEGMKADRASLGLGKSAVNLEELRSLAAKAAPEAPPRAPQPPPVPTTPPPASAAPGAAERAVGASLDKFAPDLAELGITPEMAARLKPEDLASLVEGLKAQAAEVAPSNVIRESPLTARPDYPGRPVAEPVEASAADATTWEDVAPVEVPKVVSKKVTPKGMAVPAGERVTPGLDGAKKVLMSIEQAAKAKGVATKTIRRAIKSGKLEASRVGGQWRIDPEAMDKMGPWGVRSVDPIPVSRELTAAEKAEIDAKFGKAGTRPAAAPKVDAVIKEDPRLAEMLSGLSKSQRAQVYREFAGRGKDIPKENLPALLDEIVAAARKGGDDSSGGTTLVSGIDPTRLGQAWKYPAVRAAIGGAAGANMSDDHPYLGAALGAAGGAVAGPGGGRQLNRLYYESMLAGPAQAANLLGNIGTIITTPVLEAARGNIRGAGGALEQVKNFTNPEAWRSLGRGLKQGWQEERAVKYTDELPAGPMGRSLNAVDRATKNFMEQGGMDPDLVSQYTFTHDPNTDGLKGLQYIQQRVPGMNKITPFIRTLGKQLELGAAYSPLRHLPTGYNAEKKLAYQLRDAFPVVPRANGGSEWLNPAQLSVMAPGALAVAGGAGMFGGENSASPIRSAMMGGVAAPYQVGAAYRDFLQHGRGSASDMARATSDQIPIAGDMLKIIENPAAYPGRLAERFVPPILGAFGDRTIRDPRGEHTGPFGMEDISGYLKERIPGLREDLPIKPNFFGEPEQRTMLGSIPEPLYNRDPRAAALAEMGLLRYQQSGNMGDAQLSIPEQDELKGIRGKRMMEVLDPILANKGQMGEFPDVLKGLSPEQAELVQEMTEGSAPQSEADIMRIYQRLGINLGSQEFKALRLARIIQQMQQRGGQ